MGTGPDGCFDFSIEHEVWESWFLPCWRRPFRLLGKDRHSARTVANRLSRLKPTY